jgi:signal transduction histidine kinase
MSYVTFATEAIIYSSAILHFVAFVELVIRIIFDHIPPTESIYLYIVTCVLSGLWVLLSFAILVVYKSNRKRKKILWLGLSAALASIAIVSLGIPHARYLSATVFFAQLFICVLYTPVKALTLNLLVAAVSIAVFWLQGKVDFLEFFPIIDILIIVCAFFFGNALDVWNKQLALFDRSKQAAEELARANIHLQESVEKTELASRSRERIRIAREIHDTVGYTLTAVLMQVHALQGFWKKNPDQMGARLKFAEDLVRDAISEVRDEIDTVRQEMVSVEGWREHWITVCKTFADSTNIRVQYEFDVECEFVDDETGESISKILQEALTNSYRHGRSTIVDVVIGKHDGTIMFRISDNGMGAKKLVPGNGLSGIRERVNVLGGSIVWQTVPNKGFDIGIKMPFNKVNN